MLYMLEKFAHKLNQIRTDAVVTLSVHVHFKDHNSGVFSASRSDLHYLKVSSFQWLKIVVKNTFQLKGKLEY